MKETGEGYQGLNNRIKRPEMLAKRGEQRDILWYLFYFILLFAALFLLGKMWAVSNYIVVQVQGPSMLDTLYGGELVGNHTYEGGDYLYVRRTSEAQRGDIVIVDVSQNPTFTDDKIIKRLIATGGDRIYAEDGVVYLQKAGSSRFEPLQEDYVKSYGDHSDYEIEFEEVDLKEGEIFVMGDNREISADSRFLSVPLKETDILGVVAEWNLRSPEGWAAVEAFFVRTFLKI